MDHLCNSCLVFVMLSRLFIAALWSPTGNGLTSWLSFVMLNCVFVFNPCGILGQVWYLIVSITDFCHLSYSKSNILGSKHFCSGLIVKISPDTTFVIKFNSVCFPDRASSLKYI